MARVKTKLIFLILPLGIVSLIRTVYLLWDSFFLDFAVFYNFSKKLLHGINAYAAYHIFTPPIALIIFLPLTVFPLSTAEKVWLLASVLLFCFSLYLAGKIFKLSFYKLMLVFSLSVLAFPFKFTLGMGQTNIILLFLILSFVFYLNKKEKVSALFLSLAIILKLIPVIFALELFFLKRWRVLLLTAVALTVLYVIPDLLSNKLLNMYYIKNVLLPLLVEPASNVYYNQSVAGFMARIGMPGFTHLAIRFFLIALTVIKGYKDKNKMVYAITLLLTGFLLINTFTWQHQLMLLVIPFCYFLSQKLSLTKSALLFLIYILLAVNIKNPSYLYHIPMGGYILSHGFFGLFGIWILLMLEKPIKFLK